MSTKDLVSNRNLLILAIVAFIIASNEVKGDAILDLRVLSFENLENRLEDGSCCHGRIATNSCRSLCNTFLRVCITEANATATAIDEKGDICKYGVFVTDTVFRRSRDRQQEINLNIQFGFPLQWMDDFGILLESWHKTSQIDNATFVGGVPGLLISRSYERKFLRVTDGWKKERDVSNDTVFEYVMRVSCQTAFYGNNCSQMCLDRNNDFGHYVCTHEGQKECRSGWTGPTCTNPVCRDGCNSEKGYCNRPGECHCRLGWSGPTCSDCVALPGCVHGGCRNSSFECSCHEGWDGLFCSDPICKKACHSTRGYCTQPNECRCRIGWDGELCEKCKPLPGCAHGSCRKPFECICEKGWQGLFCETAVCDKGCHHLHGYCSRPGECRCRVGWTGDNCDQCVPYPGCKYGNCTQPWECNCQPGWGGVRCDEELIYCNLNSPCLNGGTCIGRPKDDGNYVCFCAEGFTGKNCETEQKI